MVQIIGQAQVFWQAQVPLFLCKVLDFSAVSPLIRYMPLVMPQRTELVSSGWDTNGKMLEITP